VRTRVVALFPELSPLLDAPTPASATGNVQPWSRDELILALGGDD
jgi:hypothetical protein